MTDILISIIIPVYCSEKTLPLCLRSINEANHQNFEVIIVDSEDSTETKQIATQNRANYLPIKENNIAQKRNVGAKAAKGEILVFLDSDCLIPKDFFLSLRSIFANTEIVAAGSHDFTLPRNSHWINSIWQIHLQVWSNKNSSWIPTRCLAVRAEIFKLVKGFNEKLTTCEDVDIGYRLGNYGKILNTPQLQITHLTNPENLGQFFLKEMWHGLDSFSIGIKNRSKWKELIYLIIPIYFIFFVTLSIFLICSLVLFKDLIAIYFFLILLLPVMTFAFFTAAKANKLYDSLALFLAYLLYLLARGSASFRIPVLLTRR